MVEKFNFYDIYGYLLPGIVLVTLFWLPFGLFLHIWPNDLSGALVIVVLSYVIGHVVQSFSSQLLPSAITDKFGRERQHSDLMLDVDTTFTMETKNKIDQLSQKYFNLRLEPKDNPDQPAGQQAGISQRRKDAFFQARSALLKDKKASYWEQFEGLYALMRGLTAACAVAAAYFLGWGVAFSHKAGVLSGLSQANSWTKWGAALIVFFAVKIVKFSVPRMGQKRSSEESDEEENNTTIAFRVSLLCITFLAGMLLGLDLQGLSRSGGPFIMLAMALAAVIVSIRCHVAYISFARLFAEHVWRDFSNIDKPESPSPPDLV